MFILSFKTGHDPAACLLEDGKLIAAAEEERFVRVKHAADYFPEQAIRFCLGERHLTLDQVDHIVFAREKNFKTALKVCWYFTIHLPKNSTEFTYALSLLKVQARGLGAALLGRASYQKIFKILGGKPRKIYSFDHHQCHAASAFFGSPFSEAAVLCMDGKGEATSISLWHGRGTELRIIRRYGIFHSLGYLYGAITDYLGFRINDGEYKVMGLAPYGTPNVSFDDVLSVDEKRGVYVNTRYSLYPFSLKNIKKRFPGVSQEYSETAPPQPNTNIAATLQDRLEKAALWYVKETLHGAERTGQGAGKNLCLAGGVALNVKMNRAIWESGLVEKIWIQPAAGDMGNVLGSAWMLYVALTGKRPESLKHLYLGAEYADADIERALLSSGFSFAKSHDIAKETANLLGDGKIVAWFQGRFEFGPRALGARSVLADPRSERMKETINSKVKFREPFRPFCPSILEGYPARILEHYTESPYMVMSFSVKPEWKDKISAVVHVDGTARPQEVSLTTHPLYAKLLSYFYAATGVPVLLNTSLNVKGEPIVTTPEQAISFFKRTDVAALAIGNYLAVKKEKPQGT